MTGPDDRSLAVIGGGAAGYFAAIACAEANPRARVVILEGTRRPLTKVRISGGGRCNVTHNCFDPAVLIKGYPRGHKELLGPFNRFQPKDTVAWFERRGVKTKAEDDGRMFPITDDSETIAGCLERAARDAGVEVVLGAIVKGLRRDGDGYIVTLREGERRFAKVLLATGSAPHGHKFAEELGHSLVSSVPSLFTFNIKDPRLTDLAGISFPKVSLTLMPQDAQGKATRFTQTGPLLITHWGLSGPAVLKLSAWAARELHASQYKALLTINCLGDTKADAVAESIRQFKTQNAKKLLATEAPVALPRRYWQRLIEQVVKNDAMTWADLNKDFLQKLVDEVCAATFQVEGKGVFKDEFVTAGGIALKEVDFRTMESRRAPGLYFAGEILDVDGITGGYNFQNAWTTGWIAGHSIAASLANH